MLCMASPHARVRRKVTGFVTPAVFGVGLALGGGAWWALHGHWAAGPAFVGGGLAVLLLTVLLCCQLLPIRRFVSYACRA